MEASKSQAVPATNVKLRLFILGFQVLFLELILIRFLAGHIWNLGYFPNLVLLAAFIGFGFGFLLHGSISETTSKIAYALMPTILLVLVALIIELKPRAFIGFGHFIGDIDGELFFTGGEDSDPLHIQFSKFAFWFLGVVGIFFLIGQRMAKLFRLLPPLQAYSLDISGSLLGIVLFMLISFFQVPATYWFLAFALSFWLAAGDDVKRWPKACASIAPVVIAATSFYLDNPTGISRLLGDEGQAASIKSGERLSAEDIYEHSVWSPYQRLTLKNHGTHVEILSNGIGHQVFGHADIPPKYLATYLIRDQHGLKPFEEVLIIGAGAGADVEAALDKGALRVDAVDIDPRIMEFGRYERSSGRPAPYLDPRVTTIVDDGRHYLYATDKRYDLIVFALTDSLVKVSSVSQLRLENYLYTENSFRRAAEILKPGGWVVTYNTYREDWLVAKLLQMLSQSLPQGSETVFYETPGEGRRLSLHLIVGKTPYDEGTPLTSEPPIDLGFEPATDDWPFPYMKERRIPVHYIVAMGIVSLMVSLALLSLGRRSRRSDPRFAVSFTFLGAAFLLLETKGVIQFSLLFGTTWLNNSLVFFAVLVSVLLGIQVARLVRSPLLLPVAAVLLLASACVTIAVPLSSLLAFEPLPRFLLAGALMFTPIFMANLIFSILFRDRKDAELYFGWNLLGATAGGVLEYLSIATGYQALGAVVLAFYVVALGAAWLAMRPGGAPSVAAFSSRG